MNLIPANVSYGFFKTVITVSAGLRRTGVTNRSTCPVSLQVIFHCPPEYWSASNGTLWMTKAAQNYDFSECIYRMSGLTGFSLCAPHWTFHSSPCGCYMHRKFVYRASFGGVTCSPLCMIAFNLAFSPLPWPTSVLILNSQAALFK